MKILTFINTLRKTDKFIEDIYLFGGCYQFHLLLKALYPSCVPFISPHKDHVITKYKGKYYDITGEACGDGYSVITLDEISEASQWSFAKSNMLQVGECPHCGEPITVN